MRSIAILLVVAAALVVSVSELLSDAAALVVEVAGVALVTLEICVVVVLDLVELAIADVDDVGAPKLLVALVLVVTLLESIVEVDTMLLERTVVVLEVCCVVEELVLLSSDDVLCEVKLMEVEIGALPTSAACIARTTMKRTIIFLDLRMVVIATRFVA